MIFTCEEGRGVGHTSVPRAGDSPLSCENTLDQRSTVVSAVGTHGVNLVFDLGQQDLSALNAVNLDLLLLAILQVDAGKPLELVFGSHGA